jgi:hypothetical protein
VAIANFKKVAACSVRYFLPGTIWFPVTTRYYPQLPIRLRTAAESVPEELYKSELKVGPVSGQARDRLRASIFAQKLPGFLVDEMKPGAGETDDGRIGIGIGLVWRGVREPMLHIRAQPRAFEKDMSPHRGNMQNLCGRSPPYVCVVGGLGGRL